jgi:hypothetical protein
MVLPKHPEGITLSSLFQFGQQHGGDAGVNFNRSITPRSTVLLKKPRICRVSQEISLLPRSAKHCGHIHKRHVMALASVKTHTVHSLVYYLPKIHFNITLRFKHRMSGRFLPLTISNPEFCTHFSSPLVPQTARPIHPLTFITKIFDEE